MTRWLAAVVLASPWLVIAAWCKLTGRRHDDEVETSWIDDILDRQQGARK